MNPRFFEGAVQYKAGGKSQALDVQIPKNYIKDITVYIGMS